jgi:Rha family phage regulatory protein
MSNLQLVSVTADGQKIITNSRKVAEVFGKEHKNVLRDIEALDCGQEFNQLNFETVDYIDNKGETRKEYLLSKDGLVYLVMGYRGEKAAQMKVAYIKAFNEMEETVRHKHKPRSALDALESIVVSLREQQNQIDAVQHQHQKLVEQVNTQIQKSDTMIDMLGSGDNFHTVAKKAADPYWKPIITDMTPGKVGKLLATITKENNLERKTIPHPAYPKGIGAYSEAAWTILKDMLNNP